MSYGASAFPPVWKNIIGYDKPSTIKPYEKRMNADELALSLRETISRGLVLYLPFVRFVPHRPDTITKVFDRSPFGNHGTIHGAVWQTLPSGKSVLSFDEVDDYVEVPDSNSLRLQRFTITVWFKSSTYDDGLIRPFAKKGESWGWKLFNYAFCVRGKGLKYILIVGDGTEYYEVSSPEITPNEWHFGAGVYDGEYLIIYDNGVEIARQKIGEKTLYTSDDPLWISRISYALNGTIDEVRIYSRALSEEEIRRLYELTRVFYGV